MKNIFKSLAKAASDVDFGLILLIAGAVVMAAGLVIGGILMKVLPSTSDASLYVFEWGFLGGIVIMLLAFWVGSIGE